MSTKQIILAHGLNGELGVPTDVRRTGLPWPRLAGDIEFFKAHSPVLILGRATYEISKKWLENDRLLLGISASAADGISIFENLDLAIEAAELMRPGEVVTIGGGAGLAGSAFSMLEMEHEGVFYETVVHDTFPRANVFMPLFHEEKWTTPEIIQEFPAAVLTGKNPQGTDIQVPTPSYHIQRRFVR